jgi:hypothetical protein
MLRWIKKVLFFPGQVWVEMINALGWHFRLFFYDFHRDSFDEVGFRCAKLLLQVALMLVNLGLYAIVFSALQR